MKSQRVGLIAWRDRVDDVADPEIGQREVDIVVGDVARDARAVLYQVRRCDDGAIGYNERVRFALQRDPMLRCIAVGGQHRQETRQRVLQHDDRGKQSSGRAKTQQQTGSRFR